MQRGSLVCFPTETVYGLGANALDAGAVAKIFAAKERPHFDPLIVHVAHREQASMLALVDSRAKALMRAFWPGPLTLVLPKRSLVPGIVTSGLETVALRMPDHAVALELLRRADLPIAAPSANKFGRLSPTSADHAAAQFMDEFEWILDGGPTKVGLESTVLDLSGDQPRLLRPGYVTAADLEPVLGCRVLSSSGSDDTHPKAPGMLSSHYAPRTPLRFVDHEPRDPERYAYLGFRQVPSQPYRAVEVLSEKGDLVEAAARLFACLHRLDVAGAEAILAERVPATGLGIAILDRLKRAAA